MAKPSPTLPLPSLTPRPPSPASQGRFPEFEDMVLLSWTTFSTVGYGNIYPRADIDDPVLYPWCAAFNVVLILEAFSGIV